MNSSTVVVCLPVFILINTDVLNKFMSHEKMKPKEHGRKLLVNNNNLVNSYINVRLRHLKNIKLCSRSRISAYCYNAGGLIQWRGSQESIRLMLYSPLKRAEKIWDIILHVQQQLDLSTFTQHRFRFTSINCRIGLYKTVYKVH